MLSDAVTIGLTVGRGGLGAGRGRGGRSERWGGGAVSAVAVLGAAGPSCGVFGTRLPLGIAERSAGRRRRVQPGARRRGRLRSVRCGRAGAGRGRCGGRGRGGRAPGVVSAGAAGVAALGGAASCLAVWVLAPAAGAWAGCSARLGGARCGACSTRCSRSALATRCSPRGSARRPCVTGRVWRRSVRVASAGADAAGALLTAEVGGVASVSCAGVLGLCVTAGLGGGLVWPSADAVRATCAFSTLANGAGGGAPPSPGGPPVRRAARRAGRCRVARRRPARLTAPGRRAR